MPYLTNVGSPSAPNNFLKSEVTTCFSSSLQQICKLEKKKRKIKTQNISWGEEYYSFIKYTSKTTEKLH